MTSMSPRMRRLMSDYEGVRSEFSGHPHVHVEPVGIRPPERYRVTFKVRGLHLVGDSPTLIEEHRCEILLPLGYPREQPYCTPLTPVFHPNISEYFCIADYWAAGQPLVDVISKLSDMIQYRVYNTKSPLDATAAYWAEQNPELFPLGTVTLGAPELEIAVRSRSTSSSDQSEGGGSSLETEELVDALPDLDGADAEPAGPEGQPLIALKREGTD